MRHAVLVFLLGLLLATAAGCGGGEEPYTLRATRLCLEERNVRVLNVGPRDDFIAFTAPFGAIRVKFPKNTVTVSFWETEDEVQKTSEAYRRFAGRNIGIDDALRPQRNAVALWAVHPSDRDLQTIQDCLK